MNETVLINNRHGRALGRSMPTLEHRYPAIFRRGWSAIDRILQAFTAGVAEARRMSRLYDELTTMSDPELHDIGINRADIPAVISGTCRRLPPPTPVRIISSNRRERSPSPNQCDQPIFLLPELAKRGHAWCGGFEPDGKTYKILVRVGEAKKAAA